MSEWRDALVQCFSTPPSSTLIIIRSFTVSEWRDALVQCFSTPPLLYTDYYQIFHCVWMKGCSSAVLLNPPPPSSSTLIHIRSTTVSEWRDALVQCFSTPPPPLLYTDSYQIFHCVWMKGCSSAVLLNPPPPPLHWFLSDLSLCLNEGML